MFRVEEALKRLTRMLGGPDWQNLLAFLPADLSDAQLRRSALAAHLAASLELARAGMIEVSQTEPVRADLPAAPAMSRELAKRIVEALLFAAEEPLDLPTIQAHLPGGLHAGELLDELMQDYAGRGVRLERHGDRYRLAHRARPGALSAARAGPVAAACRGQRSRRSRSSPTTSR